VRDPPSEAEIADACRSDRRFVVALGGMALEIAGAALVVHEKIPSPRFNFVEEIEVGTERQTGFFERALDHYFQRAIRPTFRLGKVPPPHLDRALRALGFRPEAAPLDVWLEVGDPPPLSETAPEVREAERSENELVASFWTGERERPELRTALETVRAHPNPYERLVPLLAFLDGEPASAAVVYRSGPVAGIHLLATRPEARGHGCGSALVTFALRERPCAGTERHALFSHAPEAGRRLPSLGLRRVRQFTNYSLPHDAELPPLPVGPPSPPRWRPPRRA
jgi:GNAT superfamily N-acetyltransferase